MRPVRSPALLSLVLASCVLLQQHQLTSGAQRFVDDAEHSQRGFDADPGAELDRVDDDFTLAKRSEHPHMNNLVFGRRGHWPALAGTKRSNKSKLDFCLAAMNVCGEMCDAVDGDRSTNVDGKWR